MKNKIIYISLVCVLIFIVGLIKFLTSDWLINKTSIVAKPFTDEILGKKITWDYKGKFEDENLKVRVCIRKVDPEMFQQMSSLLKSDEEMLNLKLVDKDDFKIKNSPIYASDLIADTETRGRYCAQTNISINKKEVKKIKRLNLEYRVALDKSYKDFLKDLW